MIILLKQKRNGTLTTNTEKVHSSILEHTSDNINAVTNRESMSSFIRTHVWAHITRKHGAIQNASWILGHPAKSIIRGTCTRVFMFFKVFREAHPRGQAGRHKGGYVESCTLFCKQQYILYYLLRISTSLNQTVIQAIICKQSYEDIRPGSLTLIENLVDNHLYYFIPRGLSRRALVNQTSFLLYSCTIRRV